MADVAGGGRKGPDAVTALWRGLRKRCPHCGIGRIYTGWAHEEKRCPVCGLVYEPTEGDTWAFTIIGDRIPVAAGIIVVYFELGSRVGPASLIAVMTVLSALLLWTAPHRWGLGVALLYLQRTQWPDPLDKLPD
jgi:uncharacterized protein (DUF983 family)